ncbi:(Na+)-NQR maturation NqrM [Ketobacter sp.]|uniref:(Na+)-NQR maturation NqrM n=1 Tax=Ketobacter sp. TaxID=2083498 RepID=UPI000F1EB24D|nr:(Na+)-NQR maturation NqrM [Ketobacter sp.]RLU01470.1 MAG: (Na+)-NQR maturation NqrM [Ketobacter sp.]
MTTFFIALVFFGLVIAAMAVGVIFSNKPIQGSCGGLNNIGLDGDCEICGGNRDKCEESQKSDDTKGSLAYDATKR